MRSKEGDTKTELRKWRDRRLERKCRRNKEGNNDARKHTHEKERERAREGEKAKDWNIIIRKMTNSEKNDAAIKEYGH
jgi:hypothetical protein